MQLSPLKPIKRVFNHIERENYNTNSAKYKLSIFDSKYNFFLHKNNIPHIKEERAICFKIHDDTKVIGYLVKGVFYNLNYIY